MNPLPAAPATPAHDLAAWCLFAHELLTGSLAAACPEPARAMKRALARAYRRHLAQLGGWIAEADIHPPRDGGQRAWNEIRSALRARDERVVRAACALLHRAVIAAYDRAIGQVRFDTVLSDVVVSQRAELERAFRAAGTHPSRGERQSASVGELAESLAL